MALTPRKDEKQIVTDLLESGDYDTPDQLAGAVLKAAFEIVQRRDLYLCFASNSPEEPVAPFGPFATSADAIRAGAKGAYPHTRVRQVWAPHRLAPAMPSVDKDMCQCGHPRGTHEHAKQAGVCLAGAKTVKTRPCPCNHFE